MTQHDLPWPWPTQDEADRLLDLLQGPDHPRVTDHRQPDAIHVEHDDGRSLWAAYLDVIAYTDVPAGEHAPDPVSPLIFPVVATTRAELEERVFAIRREARVYGVSSLRQSSPKRRDLESKIKALSDALEQHKEGRA